MQSSPSLPPHSPLSFPICPIPLISGSSQDSFSQLAAPQHLNLHLYNDEQILSWAPSPPTNDTRPVVYQVEYKL